jgi:cysteine desulfurase
LSPSSDKRVYLDYNATAPLRPDARAAVVAALESGGNPSSIHAEGRAARALVEEARRAVAALVGASPRGVHFTSGGTEAVNSALTPDVSGPCVKSPIRRLILGAGEHVAALQGHRFPSDSVVLAALDRDGRLDLDGLRLLLEMGPTPVLLALQGANNETGVLQPVAEAAAMVHAHGGLVFCDAAQMAGRVPVSAAALGADWISLSAHKFGGPKGVGALIAAREGLVLGSPLLRGGGQERGARGGTENVAAISGFGAAARAVAEEIQAEAERLAVLRDGLERAVREAAPDATIFSAGAPRLPNTVAFAIPGLAASTLLMRLDLEGVAASSGSACSSGKVAASHVLAAMGVDPALARGAIRLSLGWASTPADVERFAEVLGNIMPILRHGAR